MSTTRLVTHGDASFANVDGSKSQCGVIVFLTHEPRRLWCGEFQLGHLVYWPSNTIKRVVAAKLLRRHNGSGRFWLKCGLLFRALFHAL